MTVIARTWHRVGQPAPRGVLGQAGARARLAVSAGRHQARRVATAGDVSGADGGGRHRSPSTSRFWAARGIGCATTCRRPGCGATAGCLTAVRSRSGICCGMVGRDCDVCLRRSERPEFDAWRWSEYWIALESVIEFKREVYYHALCELSRFLPGVASRRPDFEPGQPADRAAAPPAAVRLRPRRGTAIGVVHGHATRRTDLRSGRPSRPSGRRDFWCLFTIRTFDSKSFVLQCRCLATSCRRAGRIPRKCQQCQWLGVPGRIR